MADDLFSRRIKDLKKKKLASKKVVKLSEFRDLTRPTKPIHILVVDDDELIRDSLKRILEEQSYHVLLAGDGLDLSKVVEHHKPDLILLDISLPWVDGFELCRLLKEHYKLRQIPIILISEHSHRADIEQGLSLGAVDFLTKPFDVDTLLKSIETHTATSNLQIS